MPACDALLRGGPVACLQRMAEWAGRVSTALSRYLPGAGNPSCERFAIVKLHPPPLALWVPFASGVALGVPALIALLTHRLILFASLAPTSVMIAQQPLLSSTRPYNAIVGHMIGLGAGFFSVWVLGIAAEPSVFAVHAVSGGRVCAALLAIVIATALEILLKAQHPPGAATTLLAALGSFRVDWRDTWQVFVGVVAVTLAGELIQKLHPAPPTPAVRTSATRRSGPPTGAERS